MPPGPPDEADKLRDIRAISDAALSHLGAEDFLTELLSRVKESLDADTAAVLLLDRSARQLVATAASGLEEEVRQGVRIPVGQGFAGRIAAEARPVILDHVDHSNVLNPILLEKGIRSLIGVPLLVNGSVIGVLHVGSVGSRVFTGDDAALLQLAAERAALVVQSLRSRDDHAAAAALQQSLLPSRLPEVPGTEIAARYVPGDGRVGGDWYDVFTLPSGELCVVMGDVAGSGLQAAVIMGRMRSALRAYALETRDPAEVLSRLDRKIQHFEPEAMATIAYAVLTPATGELAIASAGHFPPVVAVPGRPFRAGRDRCRCADRCRRPPGVADHHPAPQARHGPLPVHRRAGRTASHPDRRPPEPAQSYRHGGLAGTGLRRGDGGPGRPRGCRRRHRPACPALASRSALSSQTHQRVATRF